MKLLKIIGLSFFVYLPISIPVNVQAITSDTNRVDAGYEESTESIVKAKLLQRTKAGKLITSVGTYKTFGIEVVDNRPASERYSGEADAKVMLVFDNDILTQAIIYK